MQNQLDNILFPLSSKYDKNWIRQNSLGENVLFNLESLCELLKIDKGMKVLDLGCGKAISAIFLAKEFGVNVWALDPKINPAENLKRIRDMGCEELILPLKLDARALPFPEEYFDIIIAVDSFMYYGTDMQFTEYISSFLKPNGQIGIVDVCSKEELTCITCLDEIPKPNPKNNLNFFHSLEWWFRLWDDSENLNVKKAEIVPQNNFILNEYVKDNKRSGKKDIFAEELESDSQNQINIFRMIAEKNSDSFFQNTDLLSAI